MRTTTSMASILSALAAAAALLLARSASASANAQAAGNTTAIGNTSSGELPGLLNASSNWCDWEVLERQAGNVSCPEAPLFTPLTDSAERAVCLSANCSLFVTRLNQSYIDDCVLYNATWLRRDYLEPLVSFCNFSNNSSLLDNSTINDGGNSTWSGSRGFNSSVAPAPDDSSTSLNSLSTVAIILLVVGSVSGGGLVTVLVVWLRSHHHKRRATAAAATSATGIGNDAMLRKLDHALLTPSTQNGSGLQDDSSGSGGGSGDDTRDADADNARAAVGLTTAMHMHWTACQGNGASTTSLGLSSSAWEDDAIVAVRIPREKVAVEALLSRGGFGEVYRGTYNGARVAIKTLLPEKRKSMRQISAFLAEVKLMAALEHARIVTFVGVAWDALSDVCVLSEYMEGGDLRALLVRFEQDRRPHGFDADKLRIALHVAHAITYLHSLQPIVLHRDLKSKNILLDSQLHAKLTDFGVSRERSDTTTMTAGVGTSLWMAPEVMLGERYDQRADMFSFGVVLSELDSHALPYAAQTQQMQQQQVSGQPADSGRGRVPVLQLVSLGRLSVQFSGSVSPALRALGAACVALDPYERPTAAEAMCALHRALKTLR